jgi:periplasmic protein TonB
MVMKSKKLFKAILSLNSPRVLLCIGIVVFALSSCNQNKKAEASLTGDDNTPPATSPAKMESKDTIWVNVDEMPAYPGGDAVLLKYIAENTQYPKEAKTNGTEGKVIVKFCVTSKGNVTNLEVLKSVSPEIDAEALRVVSTLAKFEPGKVGGRPVSVWYMVPITFSLK